jgi:CRISPR-associated endoribonuclease Cas6/Csy4 subtype I-F
MIPKHYFEVSLLPHEDYSLSSALNQTNQLLHGLIKGSGGRIALAFPDLKGGDIGQRIRLFSDSADTLSDILSVMNKHFYFRDYCRVTEVKTVPESYNGTFVSYARFRIPTLKSDRNNSGLHARRKHEAQGLPFFHLASSSTNQSFMLRFSVEYADAYAGEFLPNSYGLGSSMAKVFVPALNEAVHEE